MPTHFNLYVKSYIPLCQTLRDSDESDTASTDDNETWGGDGRHEYGRKGLPHALRHAPELVKTFGHHGAACTCVGEAGHKMDIKEPAQRGRTYGDKNLTQRGMLLHVQKQELFVTVNKLNKQCLEQNACDEADVEPVIADACDETDVEPVITVPTDPKSTQVLSKLMEELHYTCGWDALVPLHNARPPRMWGSTFLSKSVLITRNELLTLLRTKLEMDPTWESILRLTRLHIRCFGSAVICTVDGKKRKVVGVSRRMPQRRDFVRLKGTENNAALSAQVICFLQVTGLRHVRIPVPECLRVPANNTCCDDQVTLAVVRWLAPDPRSLLRDSECLPLCPPPFGANHALWAFAKLRTRRSYFSDNMFARQLHLFPGSDPLSQRDSARKLERAMYDLVQLETINVFINCTFIDDNHDSIMETITLPFT